MSVVDSESTLPTAPAIVREQPGGETMRAIILTGFGGLDRLQYMELPKPLPKPGEVVIEAAEISGVECVGIVDSCPGGEFPAGAKVTALMGGLGRTINGSHAEYTRVRVANVALIESDLPWSQLAALPETYATAWTCLFRNLKLSAGQTIVIRGATSSFGQAAVKMAVSAGARVIATRAQPREIRDAHATRCRTRGIGVANVGPRDRRSRRLRRKEGCHHRMSTR